jgi:hypothetical protein
VAVINGKNIHTLDWNRGFEYRIVHVYVHTCFCVVLFCVGGGVWMDQSFMRVLQKVYGVVSEQAIRQYITVEDE